MARPRGSLSWENRRRRQQPTTSTRRGRRRFIGPTILAVVAVVVVFAASRGPAASAGAVRPTGVVAALTARPSGAPPPARTAPACEQGDTLAAHQEPGDWARTILDTRYMLAPSYEPTDLVAVGDAGIAGHGKVRSLVIDDLSALASAARQANVKLSVGSAYRSFHQQELSYSSYVRGYSPEAAQLTVARPGHSEHQLGTTIDFEGDLAWLAANATRFGFVMSYPVGLSPERTCYRAESWHFRYIGRATASAVDASGLSLREWLWGHQP